MEESLCHLTPRRSLFSKLPADAAVDWPGARGVQHVGQRPARPVRAAVWALSPRHPGAGERTRIAEGKGELSFCCASSCLQKGEAE